MVGGQVSCLIVCSEIAHAEEFSISFVPHYHKSTLKFVLTSCKDTYYIVADRSHNLDMCR